GAGSPLTLTGSLSAAASHTSSVDTEASGDTSSSQVAIGTSVALNLLSDTSSASDARDVTAGGGGRPAASGNNSRTATGSAGAKGGQNLSEDAPSLTDRLQTFGKTFLNTSGSIKNRFTTAFDKAKGKADEAAKAQGFGVSAALGAAGVTSTTTATVADGVH